MRLSRRDNTVTNPLFYIEGKPKYVVDPESGCWLWIAVLSDTGYGVACLGQGNPRSEPAHRTSWKQARGPIPDGHELHHLCGTRRCINPDHLTPILRQDHARLNPHVRLTMELAETIRCRVSSGELQVEVALSLGISKEAVQGVVSGRSWLPPGVKVPKVIHPKGYIPLAKSELTHCKKGHEYTVENTRIRPNPDGSLYRSCKECARISCRASRKRCARVEQVMAEMRAEDLQEVAQ